VIEYEVNLEVDAAILPEYRRWLDQHVRTILALPGFVSAELFEVQEPAAADGRCALCVQYRLRGADDLERYLREHAARQRADGELRFGGRFSAHRRILRTV
jgi:hypothetical protein